MRMLRILVGACGDNQIDKVCQCRINEVGHWIKKYGRIRLDCLLVQGK
jgi:hypothetical protein